MGDMPQANKQTLLKYQGLFRSCVLRHGPPGTALRCSVELTILPDGRSTDHRVTCTPPSAELSGCIEQKLPAGRWETSTPRLSFSFTATPLE
jgi:hypothetical protein